MFRKDLENATACRYADAGRRIVERSVQQSVRYRLRNQLNAVRSSEHLGGHQFATFVEENYTNVQNICASPARATSCPVTKADVIHGMQRSMRVSEAYVGDHDGDGGELRAKLKVKQSARKRSRKKGEAEAAAASAANAVLSSASKSDMTGNSESETPPRSLNDETADIESIPENLPECDTLLEDALSWGMSLFELDRVSEGRPLTVLGMQCMTHFSLFASLNIEPLTMYRFLYAIENRYARYPAVFYHNNVHAADVLHSTLYVSLNEIYHTCCRFCPSCVVVLILLNGVDCLEQ